MPNLTLEFDEHPSAEDTRLLLNNVRTFNQARTGNESPRTIVYFLRDEERRIVAGIQGMLWGRSMHIDVLWVADNLRGQVMVQN